MSNNILAQLVLVLIIYIIFVSALKIQYLLTFAIYFLYQETKKWVKRAELKFNMHKYFKLIK